MRIQRSLSSPQYLAFTVLVCLSVACGRREAEKPATQAVQQTKPADRGGMLVTTGWLADHLGDDRLVILHVSASRESYDQAHIPGAQFVAWDEITADIDGVANELPPVESLTTLVRRLGIDSGDKVVIYDDDQGTMAARTYVTLDYLGLGHAACLLDGQLAVWKAEGRPLSTEGPQVQSSVYFPQVNPRVITSMQKVREIIEGGAGTSLVDCRSAVEFSGDTPGTDIDHGGHIPKAVNVPVQEAIESRDMPRFKPIEQLKELYAAAGLAEGGKAVTYCRTGRSSSLTYFTLKYLGYDVSLYDGSFSQWQASADNPVATGK